MKQYRVILAVASPVVRLGLSRLLERAPDILVVGEASDGASVLGMVERVTADVLLLDPDLGGMSGVEVAHLLHARESPLRMLVLSNRADDDCVLDLLEVGVLGYLLTSEPLDVIVSAVRGAARAEGGWLSRQVAERVLRGGTDKGCRRGPVEPTRA